MDKVKIGYIGTSSIMETIIEGMSLTKNTQSKIIYSRSLERAKEFSQKMAVSLYTDSFDELVNSTEINTIYIASPNKFHAQQAVIAMQHGKNVIVEKPAAVTTEEIELMYKTANENNVFFFEAITTIFMPNYILIKENLNKIGKIKSTVINFGKYSSKYDAYLRGENPNIFNPEMKAGALNDMGIYCIHTAVNLFGMPKTLKYNAEYGDNGIDLCGNLLLNYGDFICNLGTSKKEDLENGIFIEGDMGCIYAPGKINYVPYAEISTETGKIIAPKQPDFNRMKYEFTAFSNAILNKDKDFFEKMAIQSKNAIFILEKSHSTSKM